MTTTLKHVAERALVSEMTASRVLRNAGYASDAARLRVLAAAAEIGYVPNRIAGSLASQRTNLVGVLVPSITNNVYAQVLAGIAKGLDASKLQPVFGITGYQPTTEEALVREMLSWRPAGLLIAGLRHTAQARRLLAASPVPVVEMMDADGRPVAAGVGVSPREAGRAMARHLIGRGYRSIGYVAHDHRLDLAARKRHQGFVAELAMEGLAPARFIVRSTESSQALGREATLALLDASGPALDAIGYANDDLAVGGLMACLSRAMRIPSDIALCGYSGTSLELALPMRITTVRSPRFEVGERSARRITHPGEQSKLREVLPIELVVGDTT